MREGVRVIGLWRRVSRGGGGEERLSEIGTMFSIRNGKMPRAEGEQKSKKFTGRRGENETREI